MNKKFNLHFVKAVCIVLILTCTIFFTQISSAQVKDRWDDKSDELPGTSSSTTVILVAVGALLAGGLIWYLVSNGSDKDKKPKNEKASQKKVNDSKDTLAVKLDTTKIENVKVEK